MLGYAKYFDVMSRRKSPDIALGRAAQMIGLTILILGGAWLLVSATFARFIASRCKQPRLAFLIFPAFAVLPFLDEIVGRLQFAHLCKTEALVWLDPNAAAVVAVKDVGSYSDRSGLIFPVQQQSIRYADLASGKVVYSATAFHTPGGLVMRAGLGFGHSTWCWPERWTGKERGVDIYAMVKRGEQIQMLEQFATELRWLRSPNAGAPRSIGTAPEPRPLIGLSREEVVRALGAPDTCSADANNECLGARGWSYWFFAPADSKGITPKLRFQFDASDLVERVEWSFSKE